MSSRWFLYVISRCSFKLEKLAIKSAPLVDLVDDTETFLKLPIPDTNLSGLNELVLDYSWTRY